MASETFACPECSATLRYGPNLQPGAEVQCPKCKAQFPIPDQETLQAPRSRPTEEVTDAPSRRRPRFSEANDEGVSRTRRPADYDRGADEYEDEDDGDRPPPGEYSIDMGRWFTLAGNHYSSFFGPAIGFLIVAGLVSFVCNLIVSGGATALSALAAPNAPFQRILISQVFTQLSTVVLTALLIFPLTSGATAVCLAQLKGRRWTFGDFFSGFRHWGSLAGVGLISQLISIFVLMPIAVMLPFYVQNRDERLLLSAAVLLVFGFPIMLFVSIRLLFFAPALIFDRRLSALEAMKANWELTRGHFFGLLGVSILMGLITIGGVFACLVGVLFAVPYTMLIVNAGYLLIAGRREPIDRPYISND
jgi:Membrane domain of glycerophosphoryl diester phosphodiesterase